MTRLEMAIVDVKSVRKGENRAWIFDKSGVIRGDVFVCDTLDILNSWLENGYEIEDEEIDEDAIEFNTYNYNANVSNDIAFGFKDNKMVAKVHICGDARYNYTNCFLLNIGSLEELYESIGLYYKDINDTYTAYFNMFDEGFEVYNRKTDESITCYETELEELLYEIEEKESK